MEKHPLLTSGSTQVFHSPQAGRAPPKMPGPMLALGTQPCLGRPLSRSEEDMRLVPNSTRVVPAAVGGDREGRGSREVAAPAAVGPAGNLTALAPKCPASEISGPSARGISTLRVSVPPWEKRDHESTSWGRCSHE